MAAAQALRELAASYWYPVYAWWRRVGCDPARAASATEACFTRWIDREPPRADDPGAGRFREWLRRRLPVLAVSGVKPAAHPRHTVDRAWAEERYATEPEGAPDEILARRLALELLEFAIETLREKETAAGRGELFPMMLQSLAAAADAPCDPVAGDFHAHFAGDLRGLVADTLSDPSVVEQEIATLQSAVQNLAGPLPKNFAGLTPDALFAWGMVSPVAEPEPVAEPIAFAEIRRLFPQYDILGVVGTSGAGAVYRARQTTLDRLVAIKVLPPTAGADREFAARILREAQAMSRLHHEHIVAVYDVGESREGHLYYAMEYVDGEALDARLRQGALPAGAAIHVALQLCTALAHAHAAGIVHGDLKPANVLLNRAGVAKISDFGLTHAAASTTDAPEYLAPEQKRGQPVDRRVDVYAAGVLLYEMLCGEAPLGVCDSPSIRAGVNHRFDAIVQRAMQSEPERRFQTIEEMQSALTLVRDTPAAPTPVIVEAVPFARPIPLPRRTGWWIGAGIAALLIVLAAALALRSEKEALTAAEKVALARAELAKLPATPAPPAPTRTTSPKPKPKPAARKPATTPKPATPAQPAIAVIPSATPAPSTPAPAPPVPAAAPPPVSEAAQWLAVTSTEMQAAFQREVREPHETESATARQQYVRAIDAAITAAAAAGKRDVLIALRTERQRVESGQGEANAPLPLPGLAPLRAQWRTQAAKLDKTRADRARALHARYDALLAQAEAKSAGQDAQAIKARRDELAAQCLTAPMTATTTATATPAVNLPLPKGRLAPLTILARLLALNARVEVRDGPGKPGYSVAMTSDLKGETFEWKQIEFRPRPTGGAPITDHDLAILEQLPELPELVLTGLAVTDATIARLRELRLLRTLRLENLQSITGSSAAVVAALPELRSLALVNLPFDDDAIATIAKHSRLTKLRLHNLPITDAGLTSVVTMSALEDLEFGGGKIRATSEAWSQLASMRKLTRLACRADAVDPVLLAHLARCTSLTSLNFEGRAITDAALAPLIALTRLEKLNLDRTKVTGSGFKSWPVRPTLIALSLEDCPGLDDSVVRAIVAAFPKLDTLEIGGTAGAIGASGAAEFARLRQLKTLCVRGAAVTDAICAELAKLESVTHLDLGKAALTDAGLTALARLPRLQKLTISQPPITDAALKALKKFRALKAIDLDTTTPEAVLTRLRADLPGIAIRR
jgi:outer membrane biosynthesis protein TonB